MADHYRVPATAVNGNKASGAITPREIACYIVETAVILHPSQKQLIETTATHPQGEMMGDITQLAWFKWLLRLMNARKVVDVGVFTGCSALAAALTIPPNGKVYALDVCEDFVNIGKPFFRQAGVDYKIEVRIAPAIQSLEDLLAELGGDSIDFVFLDAVKMEYREYYERALKLVRPGGVIAFDNMLQGGRVVKPTVKDSQANYIRELTMKLRDDPRIDFSLLPVGDGLALARKL
ncbi:uncharacterized protein LOC111258995 [Varroa jacobsoni]|uniref:uncharacterized protein LOC111258995 n=1 Tax=Varroa jacobsoni TaxID=62625 RepID=UPI000BFA6C0A|nr:uncharacterized protein LOC111258995 [Varroa jacobsoni]